MEYCWNITPRCNATCKFCHRFLGIEELSEEENNEVLRKLIEEYKVDNITFTGGEPLLVPQVVELIAKAHNAGVKTKIVTNGLLLSSGRLSRLAPNLDQLTMSLDSLRPGKNRQIGRGVLQSECVVNVLEEARKYPNLKVAINSVLSRQTLNDIDEIGAMLDKYKKCGGNIVEWRIFQFTPLRETAAQNSGTFNLLDGEYADRVANLRRKYPSISITKRTQNELENDYTLILANGDEYRTVRGRDIKLGNLLHRNMSAER